LQSLGRPARSIATKIGIFVTVEVWPIIDAELSKVAESAGRQLVKCMTSKELISLFALGIAVGIIAALIAYVL
jgi:hypothetical protein